MGRVRNAINEWKARRAGAKFVSNDIRRQAREIVGPTGNMFSNGWETMERGGTGYLESFDRRIPPSLHISQRDRSRQNIPIPLVERCIEDVGRDRVDRAIEERAAPDN